MKDDAVSESISHFIGLFALTEEQFRLRLEYDHFRTKRTEAEEKALLEADSRAGAAPLDPGTYQPELDFKAPPPVPTLGPLVTPATPPLPQPPPEPVPLTPPPEIAVLQPPPGLPQVNLHFNLPAPSSMAAVVVQQSVLSDNDVVGGDPAWGAFAKAGTEAAMTALADLAAALSPFQLPREALDGDWFTTIDTLVQASGGLGASLSLLPGAVVTTAATGEVTTESGFGSIAMEVTLASGTAAQGLHLDGLRVEELPDWKDLLPDLLRDAPEEDEADAAGPSGTAGSDTAPQPVAHDFSKDFKDGQPGIDAAELGHRVSTGGNMLVNETTIQSTWLDAKVFVVGGDYQRVDAISQTNIIVERDSLPDWVGATNGGAGVPGPGASQAHNLASIETISRSDYDLQKAAEAAAGEAALTGGEAGDPLLETVESNTSEAADISVSATSYAGDGASASDDTPAPATTPASAPGAGAEKDVGTGNSTLFPTHWAVTTISGDLIQYNWSEQTNFVSDSDTVSFSFSGSATTLGTGDNLSVNGFNAWELGFQYDLILVGGNMIDTTVIKQTNILLDSDKLEVAAPAQPVEATVAAPSPAPAADPAPAPASAPGATEGEATSGEVTVAAEGEPPAPVPSPATPATEAAASEDGEASAMAAPPAEDPADGAPDEEESAQVAPTAAPAATSLTLGAPPPTDKEAGTPAAATPSGGTTGTASAAAASDAPAPALPATGKETPVAAAASTHPAEPTDPPPATDADANLDPVPTAPETPLPAAPPTPAVPPDPAPLKASLADNMLVNQAKITTIGEDLHADMDEAYRETLKSFQEQEEAVSTELLTKPEFAGTETLRVLYIEKDFKTVNVVQQTNVLGDDDSVELAIDEFAAGLRDEMEVTMGSNALANLASVRDSGMDSTIMTAGETYSDALLHQAEFVAPEMPEIPDMMAMKTALATEAVAFLSDDMMTDPAKDPLGSDMFDQTEMPVPSADIMQSVLA